MNDDAKTLFLGKYIQLLQKGRWEYAERVQALGAVVIVAVTPEGKLLLTEQFRIPVNHAVIELPAGLIGDTQVAETITEAAQRELLEETGYDAERFLFLRTGPSSAGLTSELITFVQADGLRKTATGGGVDDEAIIVHEVPLPELHRWLDAKITEGFMVDPKIFAGLWLTQNHNNDGF